MLAVSATWLRLSLRYRAERVRELCVARLDSADVGQSAGVLSFVCCRTADTISYDVWAADVLTNTANHGLCTSADSNGILIVRQGTTVLHGVAGTSHCGGEAGGVQTMVDHCHGDQLLCPLTSQRWVTVSGTYTAASTRTTIALHSEGSNAAYFDRVMFTEQPDPCLPSLESTGTGPPICQCARLGELGN